MNKSIFSAFLQKEVLPGWLWGMLMCTRLSVSGRRRCSPFTVDIYNSFLSTPPPLLSFSSGVMTQKKWITSILGVLERLFWLTEGKVLCKLFFRSILIVCFAPRSECSSVVVTQNATKPAACLEVLSWERSLLSLTEVELTVQADMPYCFLKDFNGLLIWLLLLILVHRE